jgi:hypothetical protein
VNPVLLFLLCAVVLPLLLAEFGDWCRWLAERLVCWSARRLGDPEACERYQEEYLANLDRVPGKVSPLLAAVGYVLMVPRMRWTLRAGRRAAVGVAGRSADDRDGLIERLRRQTGAAMAAAASERIGIDLRLLPERKQMLATVSTAISRSTGWPAHVALVGPEGSGKTTLAMLLASDLALGIATRPATRESRLPVFLPAATWDPTRSTIRDLIIDRLAHDTDVPRAVLGDLVDRGRVLPILDGLDEVRPQFRAAAAAAIDQQSSFPAPLVVTCRPSDYAVLGSHLRDAQVFALIPLRPTAAAAFLQGQATDDPRWSPLVDTLIADPGSPLALALCTPLKLRLLTAVYADPRTQPGELLDRARFPTVRSVDAHLLQQVTALGRIDLNRARRVRAARRWARRRRSEGD